jgi:pSer/pThr/pTyr-binding forkhead associated (FHA) protein
MAEGTAADSSKASLLCRSGACAGMRIPLRDDLTRIGRAPDNDAVIDGPDAGTISLYHCEIAREDGGFRVRDRNSTNGTWLDGERVEDAAIGPSAILRLGQTGPEFTLVFQETAPAELGRTLEIPAPMASPAVPAAPPHEEMLSAAVDRARHLRAQGAGGQTMTIMRDVMERALRHRLRRHRTAAYVLLAALLVVTGLGIWRVVVLDGEKRAIDAQIQELEAALEKAGQGTETDGLLSRLSDYQEKAESLQRNFLYRIGPHEQGDFVTNELRAVMAEFGAEVYSIPPDFIERVNHYIEVDCGSERPKVAHALVDNAGHIKTIQRILEEERMPADLAYIPVVESALAHDSESAAGAAGPWQLTAATARAYHLRVDGEVDERKDLVKSTGASCRYLKDLILDFGAGSSVMLALAAYNSGAGKVKQAVARTVLDPIQQRNFWYLYRTRALPLETREFVPKVFAAILVGRNPRHYGF